ncbi:MAG: hypothetical protein EOO39_41175, partial [Cytophagaceae bacterium]
GRAIDIAAFVLSNGKVLTVADNYNKLLRRIYKAGCGYFMTTLGPGSDGFDLCTGRISRCYRRCLWVRQSSAGAGSFPGV